MVLSEERESIGVLASFSGRIVKPVAFRWGKRRYRIERVHFVYRRRDGGRLSYHFGVSCQGQIFDLAFDPATLGWQLWQKTET